MLRKILALVLVLTIAVIFAGCGDDSGDQTTLNPLNTSYNPGISVNQSGNTGATGATYILTTNQGNTVPTLSTTRFTYDVAANASQISSTTNAYNNVTYNSTGVITPPSATTTRAQSTTWQTLPSTTIPTSPVVTTTGKTTKAPTPTTTKPTTTQSGPEGVYVNINDSGFDTQGRLFVTIEPDGWGGKIKSNSQRIPVYIDGVEMSEGAMLQISSSTDGDGRQYVYLNLGDYELDGSSTVSFVIPEGFLENKTATRYNYAYEVSV